METEPPVVEPSALDKAMAAMKAANEHHQQLQEQDSPATPQQLNDLDMLCRLANFQLAVADVEATTRLAKAQEETNWILQGCP